MVWNRITWLGTHRDFGSLLQDIVEAAALAVLHDDQRRVSAHTCMSAARGLHFKAQSLAHALHAGSDNIQHMARSQSMRQAVPEQGGQRGGSPMKRMMLGWRRDAIMAASFFTASSSAAALASVSSLPRTLPGVNAPRRGPLKQMPIQTTLLHLRPFPPMPSTHFIDKAQLLGAPHGCLSGPCMHRICTCCLPA